jgi:tRNA threonylcarbamoyladenosine biosynthesis protein TsaE
MSFSAKSWTTNSADETMRVGRELAGMLAAPRMLILRGDLGAGKTTLVKGIAAALGVAEEPDVTSPTFTLVHEYVNPHLKGEIWGTRTLYHLDLYRLESERELDALGIDEMMQDGLMLIEWGEKFPSLVARADGEIAIEHAGGDVRVITLALKKAQG